MLRDAAEKGQPYDLALLDMWMPEMDGLDLAAAIAADPVLTGTPCMMLTSSGFVDSARAAAVGLREWVSKPVRLSELHDALVRLVAPQQPQPPTAAEEQPRTDPARTATRRVLVVEDNLVNQLVAQGVLAELGYSAVLASDGSQGLAELERGSFAAVLMDCHMPVMDGFAATTELRRRESDGRTRTPVIAMTAGVLTEDRDLCRAAGMDDFVAKPVDFEHLRRTLERWTADEPQAAATEPADDRSAAAAPDDRRAIDPDRLEVLRRIGPADGWGLLPAVLQAFLDSSEAQLAELRAAADPPAAAADLPAVAALAHRLRGAAANLGADPLAAACAEAEELAASHAPVPGDLLQRIEQELAWARAELERVLARRG
jgi:CheY-like chemotaxis protein